jgi:hypothetical protein
MPVTDCGLIDQFTRMNAAQHLIVNEDRIRKVQMYLVVLQEYTLARACKSARIRHLAI